MDIDKEALLQRAHHHARDKLGLPNYWLEHYNPLQVPMTDKEYNLL